MINRLFPRELIFNVLSSYPSKREALSFVKKFKNPKIGLIKVNHPVSQKDLSCLATNLSHLCSLGVNPIVVMETDLQFTGDNFTYNREICWNNLTDVFHLTEEINEVGRRSEPIYQYISLPNTGYADKWTDINIDLSKIKHTMSQGHIPILVSSTVKDSQQLLIPTNYVLKAICKALGEDEELGSPFKFIIINQSGGIAIDGVHQGFINLLQDIPCLSSQQMKELKSLEYHSHSASNNFSEGEGSKIYDSNGSNNRVIQLTDKEVVEDIKTIHELLQVLPSNASAIIASSQSQSHLITNLITEKPIAVSPRADIHTVPPTLFRKGMTVSIHNNMSNVDKNKLQQLLELSFGKKLLEDYWERLETVCYSIVIAGDYDGAVIVTKELEDIIYLDKFAVDPSSQGLGVADILWKVLTKYGNVSWRSRSNNPVNKWYICVLILGTLKKVMVT
ncbi:hypothetical protein BC833DRAFT_579793 [Globomyces pollinis-pini]|nr:hypothetical protein BC833DRAFT_579793 [Globomyces pollinis-pini]